MNFVLKIDTQTLWGHEKIVGNSRFNENPPLSGQKLTHKHCGTYNEILIKIAS